MTDNPSSSPQFSTAEYNNKGSNVCRSCNQTITGSYYRVNGALACPNCAQQLQNQLPKDSHSAFVRALLFGVGGAILGLIIYAAFGIITGWMIGYISLAVGYIVGKALMKGSGGLGGRRYQIAAVLLTYFAVSMAAIPMGISQVIKEKREKQQGLVQSTSTNAGSSSTQNESVAEIPTEPDNTADKADTTRTSSLVGLLGTLLFVGLASPFLEMSDPVHGVIGLIILLVGMKIAWKLTAGRKVDILGPFGESVPPPPLG
jgi:hypothetical protein